MNKNLTFAVVGGDMRQIFLAKQLCLDGHDVFSFGIDRFSFKEDIKPISIADFSKADIIILPMPVQREKGVLNAPLCNTSYKLDLIRRLHFKYNISWLRTSFISSEVNSLLGYARGLECSSS